MNIGGRIAQRLVELGWEQKDLVNRAAQLYPDAPLSYQALHNLIKRDSKRSELDEIIAHALGVPLIWLVYGIRENNGIPRLPHKEHPTISAVVALMLDTDNTGKEVALGAVRVALAGYLPANQANGAR